MQELDKAHNDLEGCFVEWNERVAGDANMLVRLVVGHDGIAHSSESGAGPDSPMLGLCVAESIGRVKFPAGPEQLELEVDVHWSAGYLVCVPRVMAHRKVTPAMFDL